MNYFLPMVHMFLSMTACAARVSSNKRGRRSARKPMIRGSLEVVVDKGNCSLLNHWDSCVVEWLLNCNAHIFAYAGSLSKEEMEDLAKNPRCLRELHTNPNNNIINSVCFIQILIVTINHIYLWPDVRLVNEYILVGGNQLEQLLILKSEFGTLPGFTPAVDAVIHLLTAVRFQYTLRPCRGSHNVQSDSASSIAWCTFPRNKPPSMKNSATRPKHIRSVDFTRSLCKWNVNQLSI